MCVRMYEECDVHVSALFEAHGLRWNVWRGGKEQREGQGMGEGSNLRGVSHRAGRLAVFTHCCGCSAQGKVH